MASRIRIGSALFAVAGTVNAWWWWGVLHRGDWLWWLLCGLWCGLTVFALCLLTGDLARLAERGPRIECRGGFGIAWRGHSFFRSFSLPAYPDIPQPRKGGGPIDERSYM
jgi:hypothetical protein